MSDHDNWMRDQYIRPTNGIPDPDKPATDRRENYLINKSPAELAMTEDELVNNEDFQEQAQIMWEETMKAQQADDSFFNARHLSNWYRPKEGVDVARWAVGEISFMRNNDIGMMTSIPRLKKASPELLIAMANADNMYGATPINTKQVVRGVAQAVMSPTSVLGFNILGRAAMSMSGLTAREVLHQTAAKVLQTKGRQVMAAGAAEGLTAGALYSGLASHSAQTLQVNAQNADPTKEDVEFDLSKTGYAMIMGGAVGLAAAPLLIASANLLGRVGSSKLSQRFNLKRGESDVGGMSWSDSDYSAYMHKTKHGDVGYVREAEVNSNYAAYLDAKVMPESKFISDLGLDVDASKEMKPVSEMMDKYRDEIEKSPIDFVGYIEDAPKPNSEDSARLLELTSNDPRTSQARDGSSVSYRTYSNSEIMDNYAYDLSQRKLKETGGSK